MYTLRLPIEFPDGIDIVGTPVTRAFKALSLNVEKSQFGFALVIQGFENAERAEALLEELEAGLIWVLLETDLAAKASFVAREPVFPELPATIALEGGSPSVSRRGFDGAFDASCP